MPSRSAIAAAGDRAEGPDRDLRLWAAGARRGTLVEVTLPAPRAVEAAVPVPSAGVDLHRALGADARATIVGAHPLVLRADPLVQAVDVHVTGTGPCEAEVRLVALDDAALLRWFAGRLSAAAPSGIPHLLLRGEYQAGMHTARHFADGLIDHRLVRRMLSGWLDEIAGRLR